MSVSSPEQGAEPREADRPAEEELPLDAVTGLVSLGTEDAPACSDGTCW
ncbi:hypothetical protein [Nocardiopsis tropica]|uniref:FxLD family lantipeptide n=1 Tax=Nocardiopsis tropica TaxID=109330 RepID=A0ABV1ZP23_9ACTN|nr:hypothetical protein [Nocardiopsis tropica]